MPRVNQHYQSLRPSYLFAEIRKRTAAFRAAHPEARLVNLGIGDVTRPLPPAVIEAMHAATDEMARAETFQGLRALRRLRVPDRRDRRPRLRLARHQARAGRDLHQRRRQERHREPPGDLRPLLRGGADGPGVPGLRRLQRGGRLSPPRPELILAGAGDAVGPVSRSIIRADLVGSRAD